MRWFEVDGAREHMAQNGGRMPSRKVVYAMVADGMKVSRLGDSGRRLMFSAEWIDEYLVLRSETAAPHQKQQPIVLRRARIG